MLEKITLRLGIVLVWGIFLVTGFSAFAQKIEEGESIESSFQRARQLAFQGHREEARSLCRSILIRNGNYHDARVLLGRTYAWDKEYDKARAAFLEVLDVKYGYRDAIMAIMDVENWSGNPTKALFYCDYGLSFYPNDEEFLLRKANLHNSMGNSKESARILNELLEIYPGNKGGLELQKSLRRNQMKYKASLDHRFEFFEEPYIRRWHLSSTQLQRRNSWGSLIGKVNVGDLVRDGEKIWSLGTSRQYELDAYPRITKSNYAYLNYGYSEDKLFPNHRAGAELYQKLPASFEASVGGRFLRFKKSAGGFKDVVIYTGSIGKYYRNYWFSFRTYISPKEKSFSRSLQLTSRRYFRSATNYLGLEFGTGVSPDEPRGNVGDIDLYRYKSQKAKLSYQDYFLSRTFTYLVRLGFEREEFGVSKYRNIYSASLKLSYQF